MKKLIMTIAIATMLAVPAMAQVFLDDETSTNNRELRDGNDFGVMVASQDVSYDQFTPVGEGLFVLAGLAGAYLIGKRRKEE